MVWSRVFVCDVNLAGDPRLHKSCAAVSRRCFTSAVTDGVLIKLLSVKGCSSAGLFGAMSFCEDLESCLAIRVRQVQRLFMGGRRFTVARK